MSITANTWTPIVRLFFHHDFNSILDIFDTSIRHCYFICAILFVYLSMKSESESCSVMSDCLRPHGLYSPWNSPGQNTGVSSLSLLQGIFPTAGFEPRSPTLQGGFFISWATSLVISWLLMKTGLLNHKTKQACLATKPPKNKTMVAWPHPVQWAH